MKSFQKSTDSSNNLTTPDISMSSTHKIKKDKKNESKHENEEETKMKENENHNDTKISEEDTPPDDIPPDDDLPSHDHDNNNSNNNISPNTSDNKKKIKVVTPPNLSIFRGGVVSSIKIYISHFYFD